MTDSIPLSNLESSPSAKFTAIGDKYAGRIVSFVERQQTDPDTQAPKVWNDGTPRMLWVITIEQTDGSTVALWASGGKFEPTSGSGASMLNAIALAVRAAGATSFDVGGKLAVAHTGESRPKSGAKNPARLYTAQYEPPSASIPAADMFGDDEPKF